MPTLGQIVVIQHPDGQMVPAVVTEVHNEKEITVTAFLPNGTFYHGERLMATGEAKDGSLSWAERE